MSVWTGTEYLVWGGEVDGDSTWTASGWRYDPATDTVRDVPAAPIGAARYPSGAWTGSELVVCCDAVDPASGTSGAAAFDPATHRWRVSPAPVDAGADAADDAVLTGEEVLMVRQVSSGDFRVDGDEVVDLFAYDPATDAWSVRARPPLGNRFGEVAWTGDELVVWGWSGGAAYDPADDRWRLLPDLPADRRVEYGSVAMAAGWIVVFGGDASDDTATVGYRIRPDDDAWQAIAPAPIPAIEWYEGTPGSQTLLTGPTGDEVLVYPTHGYERAGGGSGRGDPPDLLRYDPDADRWSTDRALPPLGWKPDLTLGGDRLYWPNPDAPRADPSGG